MVNHKKYNNIDKLSHYNLIKHYNFTDNQNYGAIWNTFIDVIIEYKLYIINLNHLRCMLGPFSSRNYFKKHYYFFIKKIIKKDMRKSQKPTSSTTLYKKQTDNNQNKRRFNKIGTYREIQKFKMECTAKLILRIFEFGTYRENKRKYV